MECDRLEFDINLVAEDYVAHDFHSFYGKGNRVREILMTISSIIVFVALVVATFMYWYLFPLTVIIIFYPLIISRIAKYRFKSYKTRKLRENLKYILTTHDFMIEGDTFKQSYQWSDFKEVTEGSKAFYFWETDSFALVFPKRYLSLDDMTFVRKVGKINK